MREKIKPLRPGESFVSAKEINKAIRASQEVNNPRSGTYSAGREGVSKASPPPHAEWVVEITSIGSVEDGTYYCKPRYYDPRVVTGPGAWIRNSLENEYLLDLGSCTPDAIDQYGHRDPGIPERFEVGDRCLAWWHPQRAAFVADPSRATPLIRFELLEDLELGGYATAKRVIWDDGVGYHTTGQEFIVKDFTRAPGSWYGKGPVGDTPGYRGWCVLPRDNDDHRYEIVWMETIARYIVFELQEDLTTGIAGAEVLEWWNIKEPDQFVDVTDPKGLFKRAMGKQTHEDVVTPGAYGIAIYNEKEDVWVVVECQTKAGWLNVTMDEDMGDDLEGEATIDGWHGTQQDIQNPGTGADQRHITIHALAGISEELREGDKVVALYDADVDRYYALPKADKPFYAATYENWTQVALPDTHYVKCKIAASRTDNVGVGDLTFNVYLPNLNDRDPNVIANRVLVAAVEKNTGDVVCLSSYDDDPIGTVRYAVRADVPSVPPGWAFMDGIANSAANGGSGIDARARFVRNVNGDTLADIGASGGDDNIDPPHSHNHRIGCLSAVYDPTNVLTVESGSSSDIKFYAWKAGNAYYDIDGQSTSVPGSTSTFPFFTGGEDPMYVKFCFIERLNNSANFVPP